MRDPFCKNEVLDPGMERMVERMRCGDYDHHEPLNNGPGNSEGNVWRNPDGRIVNLPPVPMSVRYLPPGTRIEVTNRYRGIYVGGGIMISDARRITSYDPNHLFEKVWVRCNPHRVAIQPDWEVERI
jgi:hypothetical protein